MSYFYITQSRYANGRLKEVRVHQAVEFDAQTHTLDAGKTMRAADVADLIARGDIVYVSLPDSPGRYKAGASVVRKHGTDELICLENWGIGSNALQEIP